MLRLLGQLLHGAEIESRDRNSVLEPISVFWLCWGQPQHTNRTLLYIAALFSGTENSWGQEQASLHSAEVIAPPQLYSGPTKHSTETHLNFLTKYKLDPSIYLSPIYLFIYGEFQWTEREWQYPCVHILHLYFNIKISIVINLNFWTFLKVLLSCFIYAYL